MRRRVIVIGAVAAGAVGTTFVVLSGSDGDPAAGTAATIATSTALVEQRDLVVSDTYDGTLGFGAARAYAGEDDGVVTTVADAGAIVEAGAELFSVDFEPTVLLIGAVPAYRALDSDSSDGPDVAQLEQAMVDLGFGDGVTVDEDFDSATAAAVERWEEALGRDEPDGVVELGDIVFSDAAVRIATVTSDVGTRVQSGTTVVEATSTTHVVTVDLDADRSNELGPGTVVQLTMPDGTETTGTVSEVGTEAEASTDTAAAAPGGGGGEPTVPVTITLDDPASAASFDTGTVDVAIERAREDGALTVPVTALLALAEGGYAVEVVDGSVAAGSRLVGVTVGTYSDGFVGISGEGIEPGVEVVVPA